MGNDVYIWELAWVFERRPKYVGAERQWIKSGLTVHKLIFQTANSAVNAIVHSAKTAYYNSKILACSTSKQLHNITNTLLGKSESSPLPSTVHHSHLPQAFADFFANKIATIRHSLDIDSTSSLTCNDPQFLGQPLAAFLFLRLLSRTSLGNLVSKLVSLTLSQLPSSVSVLTLFFPTLQLLLITLLCLAPSLSPSNLLS